MLAPRRVELDEGELLLLDKLGEVISGEDDDGGGRRLPVGVGLLLHVLHDLVGGAAAVVLFGLFGKMKLTC